MSGVTHMFAAPFRELRKSYMFENTKPGKFVYSFV
jgi:hypothetical protein